MAMVHAANDGNAPAPRTGDNEEFSSYVVQTLPGTTKVAATKRVWGPKAKLALAIGIGCMAYIYSLDGTTTYLYLAEATSSFGEHSLLSTVTVAQAIILAVTKPPAAKFADLFGRAEAYVIFVVLYAVGYIVIASATSVQNYAGGAVIYSFGSAGIQILQQIVISDLTTLRWRTLMTNLVSAPFLINAFVSANIANGVLKHSSWRWGYAMFCIIVPVASLPIITVLFWAQHRAKRLGLIATDYHEQTNASTMRDQRSFPVRARSALNDLDFFGLLLFAAAWSLLLIPLTIVNNGKSSWQAPHIIAMIVLGAVGLVVFGFYEVRVAKFPIIPPRFIKSKTVVATWFINFFDFVSFYLQFTYQYSFMFITHETWSVTNLGYFSYTQTVSLTIFGILAGVYSARYRRLKKLLIFGTLVRLFAVGLMIHSKGAHGSTAELVIVQALQGMGGGIAAGLTQTAAQASVPHADLGTVTASVLLMAEIGGAIGTAVAGAIWRNVMPRQLEHHLSGLVNSTTITEIYGSITIGATYPPDSPVHKGIVDAYTHVMIILLIPATCLAVVPVIAAFFVDDIELGDTQNAVEEGGDVPLPAALAAERDSGSMDENAKKA